MLPGLEDGTRHLLLVRRHGALAAVGIAKDTDEEQKICTVRVAPEYAGRGLGVRVFDGLMDWLGNPRPYLTVSDSKLGQFRRLFEHFGYEETSSHGGLYLPQRTELFFNETRQ